jgi:hypothetical protein
MGLSLAGKPTEYGFDFHRDSFVAYDEPAYCVRQSVDRNAQEDITSPMLPDPRPLRPKYFCPVTAKEFQHFNLLLYYKYSFPQEKL